MAALTYDELVGQIASRLGRSDLDPDVDGRYIIREMCVDRIDYWKKECFYAGQVIDASITTVAGTKEYPIPEGWEEVNEISLLQGGVWITLTRDTIEAIESVDVISPSIQTLPSLWCLHGDNIRLGIGAPNGAYTLQLIMNLPDGPPAAAASNFWTADGKSLVINGVAAEIADTTLNDPVRADRYRPLEQRDLAALQAKTTRHRGGIQIRPYL